LRFKNVPIYSTKRPLTLVTIRQEMNFRKLWLKFGLKIGGLGWNTKNLVKNLVEQINRKIS